MLTVWQPVPHYARGQSPCRPERETERTHPPQPATDRALMYLRASPCRTAAQLAVAMGWTKVMAKDKIRALLLRGDIEVAGEVDSHEAHHPRVNTYSAKVKPSGGNVP